MNTLLALSISTLLFTSTEVTTEPGGVIFNGSDGTEKSFATLDECIKQVPIGDSTCSVVTRVHSVGICDVPKPELPQSERELMPVQDPKDDTIWYNWEKAYVKAPYPACWTLGWEYIEPGTLEPLQETTPYDNDKPTRNCETTDGRLPCKSL